MSYTIEQYVTFTATIARACETLDEGVYTILARDPDNQKAKGALAVLDCIDKIYEEVFGE